MKILNVLATLVIIFCFVFFPVSKHKLVAQEEKQAEDDTTGISVESIESLRSQAAASQELDEESKKSIETWTQSALDGLKEIQKLNQNANKYLADAETVPERVSNLQQQLEKLNSRKPESSTLSDIASLEQAIAKRQTELTEQKALLKKNEAEPVNRANRKREINSRLLTASQRLIDIQTRLESPAPSDEQALVTEARRLALTVSSKLIDAERPALQSELARYKAEDSTDFVRLNRDIASRQVKLNEAELQLMQEQLNKLIAIDSKNNLRMAREAVNQAPEPLKEFAEQNLKYAEAADQLALPIQEAKEKLRDTKSELEQIQKSFQVVERRVKEIGLTGSIGAMLRRRKAELPDLRELRNGILERKFLIEEAQYKMFEYDDLRSESVDQLLARTLAEVPAEANPSDLEAAARALIESRRSILDDVIRRYKSYLDTQFDLDANVQLLSQYTDEYQSFIDERVLWTRSSKNIFHSFDTKASDSWALTPDRWRKAGNLLVSDWKSSFLIYLPILLLLLIIVSQKGRLIRLLEELGDASSRGSSRDFSLTIRAAIITILLALSGPALLLFIGWRLNAISLSAPFSLALSKALIASVWVYFPYELLRYVSWPKGLAEAHFNWSTPLRETIRIQIRWSKPIAILITFLVVLLRESTPEYGAGSIERIVFIIGMIGVAFLCHGMMKPEGGILQVYYDDHPESKWTYLQVLWHWMAIVLPLCLAIMTIAGFHYTAISLAKECYYSILLLLFVVLVNGILQRSLTVIRRKIRVEQYLERREQEAAADAEPETDDERSLTIDQIVPLEEQQPDVIANTRKTRRIVNTCLFAFSLVGLWMIWIDVLPALRILDRWPLWTTTINVSSAANSSTSAIPSPSPTGTPNDVSTTPLPGPTEKLKTVTMGDMAFAILIAIVTLVCAKNIPGLMEMVVLQRLPLDNSIRYAITTLSSYLIVLIGIFLTFNALSIGWSKIQWLATALTFGLAFGLQEIFANFVAGIILLFERPIRVGDVVTIDDITGVVSKMRIRATTITNWDRKDYVVPNKEFITGRVLNWTLSDPTNRVVVPVGVAYGCDMEMAKTLLKKTCDDHPLILEEPKPLVTFEGFGDNSLNLVIRAFLPDLDNRLSVIDDLHSEIDKVFREANIEISFPQRDLHLRSVDEDILASLQTQNQRSKDQTS